MNTIISFLKVLYTYKEQTPDRNMIVDQGGCRSFTYDRFFSEAEKITGYLNGKQLMPNTFIPVCLKDDAYYYATEVAIWLAGHAVVHLGTSFPKERIDYIVKDCNAPFVFDETMLQEALLHTPSHSWAERRPDSPCAMFYTSGSLGNPKGVMHTDAAIISGLDRFTGEKNGFEGFDSIATSSPCYFVAILIAYSAMRAGATLHQLSPEIKKDIKLLEAYFCDHEIESGFLSPSILKIFHSRCNRLKKMETGSERVVDSCPDDYTLINLYGQTETALLLLSMQVDRKYDNTPVGTPAKDIEVCLLDESGNPVADGEVGELCVKNGIVPPTYHNDPERTKELMRGGVLHTGDLMRRLPSGDYLFVNRKDWMVKINGQRVETGEVEQTVKRIPNIKDAIVKGFTTKDLTRQYLVGYYIADKEIDYMYFEQELSKSLPMYMIPQYFIRMDKFPLNANNKLDRKALLPPDEESLQSTYVAPSTDTERIICEAFAKVLKLQQAGLDDDFIRIGGDSIRLMQVQNECPTLNLSSKIVYQERTPRKIALALEVAEAMQNIAETDMPDYPLSTVQQVFLGFGLSVADTTILNFPVLHKLGTSVDLEKMRRAVETVVNAHPSMRMHIIMKEDETPRLIKDDSKYSQTIETMTDAEFESAKETLAAPFNLIDSPMFRVRIIRTEHNSYLFYDFHHLIFDGMSIKVFVDEINKAYNGEEIRTEEIDIFHVNVLEEKSVASSAYEEARQWFAKAFKDAPKETIPVPDMPMSAEPAMPTFSQIRRKMNIPTQVELAAFCKEKNITLNVLFMASGAYLTGHHCGLNEALVSASYHGRTEQRMNRTFGFLAKPREMRLCWQQGMRVDDYLRQSKEHIMGNMTNDIYPITQMYEEMGISPNVILYMYEGDVEVKNPVLGGEKAESLELSSNLSAAPICYYIYDNADGSFDILCVYIDNMYSEQFINQSIADYEYVITEMTAALKLDEITIE